MTLDLIRHATTAIADVLLDGDLGHAIADLADEVTVNGYARMIAERILEALIDTNIRIAWDPGITTTGDPLEDTLNRATSHIRAVIIERPFSTPTEVALAIITHLADEGLVIIDTPNANDAQRALAQVLGLVDINNGRPDSYVLVTITDEHGLTLLTSIGQHPTTTAVLLIGAAKVYAP